MSVRKKHTEVKICLFTEKNVYLSKWVGLPCIQPIRYSEDAVDKILHD